MNVAVILKRLSSRPGTRVVIVHPHSVLCSRCRAVVNKGATIDITEMRIKFESVSFDRLVYCYCMTSVVCQDCQYISAMQPPGAGRNTIDPRVISLYACLGVTFPAGETVGSRSKMGAQCTESLV
eukprot:4942193-Amphidinium_carterae.1